MLDLCATKAKQVINGWMSSNKIAIHDEELSCIRNLIVETIEKKVSVTKEDFEESLATKTIIVYLTTFVLQNLTELFAAVIFFP